MCARNVDTSNVCTCVVVIRASVTRVFGPRGAAVAPPFRRVATRGDKCFDTIALMCFPIIDTITQKTDFSLNNAVLNSSIRSLTTRVGRVNIDVFLVSETFYSIVKSLLDAQIDEVYNEWFYSLLIFLYLWDKFSLIRGGRNVGRSIISELPTFLFELIIELISLVVSNLV